MKHREETEGMANRIWNASRTELFMSMRQLGPALDALRPVYDISTAGVGTDGMSLRYHPDYVFRTWLAHPYRLNRAYVHMLLHCLFLHMYTAKMREDALLWDLCCDIAAESILDSMDADAVSVIPSDLREEWYGKLRQEVHVLTAERLYEWFRKQPVDGYTMERLRREFAEDDHGFWRRLEDPGAPMDAPDAMPDAPDGKRHPDADRKADGQDGSWPPEDGREWEKLAKRLKEELEAEGTEASDMAGQMVRTLRAVYRERRDYRQWLSRFAVLREETRIDPDSFDYGFYAYGLSLYGNMPLIEENEFCESKRIDSLVIAIDTSASCQAKLVQEFVSETASILLDRESFFQTAEICIMECDNRIQNVRMLRRPEDARAWLDGFTVSGGYGTDFRPVFDRVREMRRQGMLKNLRGLLYFTDGMGIWPEEAAPYDTAFLLPEDVSPEVDVPDWALVLYRERVEKET